MGQALSQVPDDGQSVNKTLRSFQVSGAVLRYRLPPLSPLEKQWYSLIQGSPAPRSQTGTGLWPLRNLRGCTAWGAVWGEGRTLLCIYSSSLLPHLLTWAPLVRWVWYNKWNAPEKARNHPLTWSVEKLSSVKTSPGAKKGSTLLF